MTEQTYDLHLTVTEARRTAYIAHEPGRGYVAHCPRCGLTSASGQPGLPFGPDLEGVGRWLRLHLKADEARFPQS